MEHKNYSHLPEIYRNRPVVILGNSPSVNQVDLSDFEGIFTIGVNRILKKYVPHALLFCDHKIAREEQDDISRYKGVKLVYQSLIPKHPWLSNLDNLYTWNISSEIRPSSPDLTVCETRNSLGSVQGEGSTPAYAIQIAHVLGCNPICLIGVDYTSPQIRSEGSNDSNTHFYGAGMQIGSTGGGGFAGRHETWFSGIREQLNNRNVRTINLSPDDNAPFHRAGWERMSTQELQSLVRESI